jgi:hypothetical protein
MRGHSSLGALVANHAVTASKRSIPRAEADPTDFEATPWKKPRPLKPRTIAVGSLSVGDSFTIDDEEGIVLGRGHFVLKVMQSRVFVPKVKAWDPTVERPEAARPKRPVREAAILVRRDADKTLLLLRPITQVVIR